MKITLNNSFHGSSTNVVVEEMDYTNILPEDGGPYYQCNLSSSQYRKASRKLCGMQDCSCKKISGASSDGITVPIRVSAEMKEGILHL